MTSVMLHTSIDSELYLQYVMTAVIEMFRLFVLCEVFTVIKTALK